MRAADAFAEIKAWRAVAARRTSWHPNLAVYPDNVQALHLYDVGRGKAWPWAPHSIDVNAADWETVALAD